MAIAVKQGLESVVAADSGITWIDGQRGELRYRGYPVGDLARSYSFEQIVLLLWRGELPSPDEAARFSDELDAARAQRADLVPVLQNVPASAHPLDVLRYVVSWDALIGTRTWDNSTESNRRKSTELVAWFPVVVAALHRLRTGKAPVTPQPHLDTAANFLYMLHGKPASDVAVRTMNTSLVLHADHELNASTFAARVTIATQSNLHAAIVSALGTLSGPRHGGASDRVIDMLHEIGDASRAEAYVDRLLGRHERVMGFGHRVYRVADPRSAALREMAAELLAGSEREHWLDILQSLSRVVENRLGLFPNVDLYASVVNYELGIAPSFYTSAFAVSRIAGWTAHAVEQLQGRMIRPVASYTGPDPRPLPASRRATDAMS